MNICSPSKKFQSSLINVTIVLSLSLAIIRLQQLLFSVDTPSDLPRTSA